MQELVLSHPKNTLINILLYRDALASFVTACIHLPPPEKFNTFHGDVTQSTTERGRTESPCLLG